MYLHIGGDTALQTGRIIGLFDLDGCSRGQDTSRFLQSLENAGRLPETAEGALPRTFAVTDDNRAYLSPITTLTLQKRLSETGTQPWM